MTALPPQPNFFTLACADVERMTGFFRALGWPEATESDERHRVFQCTNGVVFALYAAENYERDVAWKRGSTVSADGGLTW